MAAPTKPYVIAGKISATNKSGIIVKSYNRTTKESKTTTTNSAGEFQFDLGNPSSFATVYTNGDVIDINIVGFAYGATTHTVNTTVGSVVLSTITLTLVSTSNCSGVSI